MWQVIKRIDGSGAYYESVYSKYGESVINRFSYWEVWCSGRNVMVPLYVFLPANPAECKKVIFSIHGVKRNANKYRNIFIDSLRDQNVLLVAPKFNDHKIANSLALKLGNMRRRINDSSMVPEYYWTFSYLEEMYDLFKISFPKLSSFSIFGHSAGGQFAYRYALFGDSQNLATIIVANAGWYTLLDPETPFPYGSGNLLSQVKINEIYKKNLVILNGGFDIFQDERLRSGRYVQSQGINRYERAKFAYKYAKSGALNQGVPFLWRYETVDIAGHSSSMIAPCAVKYLI